MIDLTPFLVELSPKQKDMVGIPVMPYIIDPREDHGVMPTSWELKQEVRNLLHDASAPHIKPSWESGFKTTNLSTDIENKEAWTKVDTISELTMALENYGAAWAIFWPHDRSATTLRRTVTNLKEFPICEPNTKATEST